MSVEQDMVGLGEQERAILERAEKATKPPWKSKQAPMQHEYRYVEFKGSATPYYDTSPLEPADADFIAHARQDVPLLLAALAAERRRNATLAAYVYSTQNSGQLPETVRAALKEQP